MARKTCNLGLLLAVLLVLCGRAVASSTATIYVSGSEVAGDSGTITISLNISTSTTPVTETVSYGTYSTAASIASAFGAKFTQDWYTQTGGLSAQVVCGGNTSTITFTIPTGAFGAVEISGSTTSFNLNATSSAPTGFASAQQFAYSNGELTMSSTLGTIFYTTDGSTATEASIKNSGSAITVPAGTTINAVVVQMSDVVDGTAYNGVAVQNAQKTWNNWKTNLACYESQCSPYFSQCSSTTSGLCSPNLNFPVASDCPNGSNSSNQGCLGVQGIPTQVGMTTAGTLPTVSHAGLTANFSFTTQGYPNSSINGSDGGASEYYGTQVLWPYNSGGGCDFCTSMVEDFYIWPGENANSVENWELDMNSWKATPSGTDSGPVYLGASFQCSVLKGGWEYNGQSAPGWTKFNPSITHDCPLPTGTLSTSGGISATATSFSVSPNSSASTVEPGMILWFNDGTDEEILCMVANANTCTSAIRGWANTTPQPHLTGAAYSGSVHVQYHVTFLPGWTGTCSITTTVGGVQETTPEECVFIDYLILNNVKYDFHAIYGTQTVNGIEGYSKLTVPATSLGATYPDRVYDQKQIDTCSTTGSVCASIGSSSSPLQVSEYVDQDNVTASFGICVDSNNQPLVYSYVVP